MPITAYVKNKRNNILPQNRCLVALLFKDGGGLANHPLSCHPQGVFGRWENARKGNKNERKGKQWENSRLCILFQPKKKIHYKICFELIYCSKKQKDNNILNITYT